MERKIYPHLTRKSLSRVGFRISLIWLLHPCLSAVSWPVSILLFDFLSLQYESDWWLLILYPHTWYRKEARSYLFQVSFFKNRKTLFQNTQHSPCVLFLQIEMYAYPEPIPVTILSHSWPRPEFLS